MKDEEWIVTVYEFNENSHQYQFSTTVSFGTNERLLEFIKERAKDTTNIRYTISYIIQSAKKGEVEKE